MESKTICPCGSLNIDIINENVICLSCGDHSLLNSWMLKPKHAQIDKEYLCYREGEYVGDATFVDDENIGLSFIKMAVTSTGELVHEVIIPELIKLKS